MTYETWTKIRTQFDEDEKAMLNGAITDEIICLRGCVIAESLLPPDLLDKLKKAQFAEQIQNQRAVANRPAKRKAARLRAKAAL